MCLMYLVVLVFENHRVLSVLMYVVGPCRSVAPRAMVAESNIWCGYVGEIAFSFVSEREGDSWTLSHMAQVLISVVYRLLQSTLYYSTSLRSTFPLVSCELILGKKHKKSTMELHRDEAHSDGAMFHAVMELLTQAD